MIDRDNVIKGLEYCIDANGKNCPMACHFFQKCFPTFESTEPFYPIMRAVLDLLKEQEAVEPILKRKGKSKMYNDYVCPVCDNEVVYEQCYCSECGKPFLWEGR